MTMIIATLDGKQLLGRHCAMFYIYNLHTYSTCHIHATHIFTYMIHSKIPSIAVGKYHEHMFADEYHRLRRLE